MPETPETPELVTELYDAAEALKSAIDDVIENSSGDAKLDFMMRLDPAIEQFRAALTAIDED